MDGVYYPQHEKSKRRFFWKRLTFAFLVLFLAVAFSWGMFFIYKLRSTGEKISTAQQDTPSFISTIKTLAHDDASKLNGYASGRINVLLLGIAGKGKAGQNLTDTIMIMSLDTEKKAVALLSIPRDFLVKIPETNMQTKINSIFQYGLKDSKDSGKSAELLSQAIEDITGQKMDYYAILNYEGFVKIVDAIGGINIMNERDIYDNRYPGPNYSYETFELKKGFHHLDGATALKYVRERHDDPQGDFGRAKRQQQVMQATKNKIFSVGTLLNVFTLNEIFNALGENIITNIKPQEIGGFLELSKKLDTQNINNMVVDAWNKDSLLKVTHVDFGGMRAFALIPRTGNYSEIKELAQEIFDLNAIKHRKEEINKENASIAIVNRSNNNQIIGKIKKLLNENFNYKNVEILTERPSRIEESSTVYDLTNGNKPFTLDEIASRMPAKAAYNGAPFLEPTQKQEIDIILVIGKDLIEKYNMEEGTIEDLNNQNDEQENEMLNTKY